MEAVVKPQDGVLKPQNGVLKPRDVAAGILSMGDPDRRPFRMDGSPLDRRPTVDEQIALERLSAPIKTASEKTKLIPAFLAVRGLVRQHLDSFNYFVSTDLKKIIRANDRITSDVDPRFFMRFEDISVLPPSRIDESTSTSRSISPHECRLRDMTYSSPVEVTIRYTRGEEVVVQRGVRIGSIPIMLRSQTCNLYGKSHADMAEMKECPQDPGGYFVVKGTEKVLLMQEQLSRNRIIVENDDKGFLTAAVQSSAYERRTRTAVVMRAKKFYMCHSSLEPEGVNLATVFRAMGVESDLEMVSLVGSEPKFAEAFAPTIEECAQHGVRTSVQALRHMGNRTRFFRSPFPPSNRFGRGGGMMGGRGGGPGRPGTTRAAPSVGPDGQPIDAVTAAANKTKEQIQRKIDLARDILATSVLSHVPVNQFNFAEKVVFLGQMVRRILKASEDPSQLDDKDYYGNKRVELPGQLLRMLFTDLFKKFTLDLKRSIDSMIQKEQGRAGKVLRKEGKHELAAQVRTRHRSAVDVTRYIRTDTIAHGMEFAVSTGNWSLKQLKMERSGCTEVLSRLSYIAALGMMTRVASQFDKTRKVSGPRSLQPSQWGMLCPSDTPEGEACGLVKNLALLSHVTTEEEEAPLIRLLHDLGVQGTAYLSGDEVNRNHTVFLNGCLLGIHARPAALCKRLRNLRRRGLVGEFVSVFEQADQSCVYVASDCGRLCRPLVVVDQALGKSLITDEHISRVAAGSLAWQDLVNDGIVEYVDVNEHNNCLIATWDAGIQKGLHTHVEIAPLTVLGVCAGLIPYPHHNQSPRNTYQCAMGKQAIGAIAYNQLERTDTLLFLLSYPQRPLVQTRTIEMVGFERLPGGQNASLCVMSYSGYDIEDAIVLNKASLDRGFGRCSVVRKSVTGCRRQATGASDRIMRPPDDCITNNVIDVNSPEAAASVANRRAARFSALDMDGMAAPGTKMTAGHIYVNKEVPTDAGPTQGGALSLGPAGVAYRSTPLIFKGPTSVVVEKVCVTSNDADHVLVKTMLRDTRRPELGDKFSSRHGQKGVCGLIAQQEDMPFSEKGICPDLIMNPHGFPSRMTVGKMIEFVAGKAGTFEGRFREGTAFDGDKVGDCARALVAHGYNYNGKDIFQCGITGETLRGYVFAAPVFYQKLKHMVQDKMHARSRGPRALLTRQPTEGRSRDGGLRLGEMERDCLIGYGASMMLMERLMISSDAFTVYTCMTCGLLTFKDWCQSCSSGATVAEVKIPYACKLLFQELQSMNVVPRLALQES